MIKKRIETILYFLMNIDWKHAFRDSTRKIRAAININKINKGKSYEYKNAEIVFIIGCNQGESKRYRVYNIADGLREIGYNVEILPGHLFKEILKFSCLKTVVLFRFAWDPNLPMQQILEILKSQHVVVISDFDDLVFDISSVSRIDGYLRLSDMEQKRYRLDVMRYRKVLEASDRCICSTHFLAKKAEYISKVPSFVVPNTLCKAQILGKDSTKAQFRKEQKRKSRVFTIFYGSGTQTHQKDFEECAEALLEFLKANQNARFVLVGFLELPESFSVVSKQIIHKDFMPFQELQLELCGADVNIAPLEQQNSFNDSKSELKFFEAAIVEVPTIASATDTYCRCIENNVNGIIARNKSDWLYAFNELYLYPEKRIQLGKMAYKCAIMNFKYDDICRIASVNIYGLHKIFSISNKINIECLHIAWIIPGFIKNSGGHRNILRTAYYLSCQGHKIALYFTNTNMDDSQLRSEVHSCFYPIDAEIMSYTGELREHDIIFATHWTTVEIALKNRNKAREIFYFVQDFEPYFAPLGTEYILAENTYRKKLYCITSGPWCKKILEERYSAEADSFLFPVDTGIYHLEVRKKHNENIIFFAKPEMPRRCYELGLLVFQEFHKLRPDVEIIFFGSNLIDKSRISFPVTLKGVLPSLEDLARLYNNADMGIVFSTTNPSLVPYEMMACGLPVADLRREDNHYNYGMREDIALLCDPEPEKMAVQLVELLENPVELSRRRENGLAFVSTFPSESEMGCRVEMLIKKKMQNYVN